MTPKQSELLGLLFEHEYLTNNYAMWEMVEDLQLFTDQGKHNALDARNRHQQELRAQGERIQKLIAELKALPLKIESALVETANECKAAVIHIHPDDLKVLLSERKIAAKTTKFGMPKLMCSHGVVDLGTRDNMEHGTFRFYNSAFNLIRIALHYGDES